MNYYNSRSSYSDIRYLANTGDENKVSFEFSRNITRNWNFGAAYYRINSNKQFGLGPRDRNSLAASQDFKVFSSFKSKDERYHFMGSFSYFVHKLNEQGGLKVRPEGVGANNENYKPDYVPSNINSWPVWLDAQSARFEPYNNSGNIYSRDRRVVYHFYHQYDIFKRGKLSIFHEFDRRNQKFRYEDPFTTMNAGTIPGTHFYDTTYNNKDTTYYNIEFSKISNKVGIKGTWNSNFTWIVYGRFKRINSGQELSIIKLNDLNRSSFDKFFYSDPQANIGLSETYAGGEFIYRLNDYAYIDIKGEGLIGFDNTSKAEEGKRLFGSTGKGDHQISIEMKYYNIMAGASRILYSPAIIENYMDHNTLRWNNSFGGTISNRVYLNYQIGKNDNFISLTPSYTNIYQYIYLTKENKDSPLIQKQTKHGEDLHIFSADAMMHTHFRRWHFEIFGKYTYVKDTNIIRVPQIYLSSKIYYQIIPKKKINRQQFMFGFDFHFRSSYFGDKYMPAISQFYQQEKDFILNDYLVVDVFASAKIRNARVFGKFNQLNTIGSALNQKGNGYYITPGYPSTRPFLTFGVEWMLFE